MKIITGKKLQLALLILIVLILNSCLGLSMDIQMNRNGSGKLFIEYKISNLLGGLGSLDGNEKWPVIPAGENDWKRTLDRINGASLSSFSISENRQDTAIKVTIDYDNPKTLLKIIDPEGKYSFADIKNNSRELNLIFDMKDQMENNIDKSMIPLIKSMFEGYNYSLSFSSPSDSRLSVTDRDGKSLPLPSGAEIIQSGRKVSFTAGMADFLNITDNIIIKINY